MIESGKSLTIGEVARRSGVATSAVRYYEAEQLITAGRNSGGQRRFEREVLRRIAFIRVAQRIGLSLAEIRAALARLPDGRTPTVADWEVLSSTWRERLDREIDVLIRLRDELGSCIGCGCLSLDACHLYNPADGAGRLGAGARYLLGNRPSEVTAD